MMPLYVYGGNFTSQFMFDTITHNFQFPHEKMGIIMHKHINNHTIPDNHTIVNQDERYLSNTQINMIEMQECGLETDDNMRSYISGVRVNYCFKCSHTSSYLADINSCKYDVVNTSPNNFIMSFHTYTDSTCSTGDIYQFSYVLQLTTCSNGFKAVYTEDFQFDVSIPGMNKVEYSDTSCSTPFAFEIMGIIKESCLQISGSSSMEIVDCTNNNLQTRLYSNSYCGGNGVYQTEQQGICSVPASYLVWYEDLSSSAIIDYSSERLRSTRYCSSLYSSTPNPSPSPPPTSNIGIIPPTNDDTWYIDTESCDTCPLYNIWEVKCGVFGTANTDIMCDDNGDQFTCCSTNGSDCCVANGGTITLFILGIIISIVACGYKLCGCPSKQQIANITNSTPSTLDRNANAFSEKRKNLYTQSGSEIIKPTIKPFQKDIQATLSNTEGGVPFAEAKMIPVQQKFEKTKESKKKR